jgi:hypothetical protein
MMIDDDDDDDRSRYGQNIAGVKWYGASFGHG